MAVARVDADAVFSLLTGAETEREFDRVGRRLTRRLTNGRFETLLRPTHSPIPHIHISPPRDAQMSRFWRIIYA